MRSDHPSAVVIPVPEADPLVSRWRGVFDPAAKQGMPAHITALYPFLATAQLDHDVRRRLPELCDAVPILEVEFRRTGRFPGVLYLDPEPAGELERLAAAVAAAWPEAPPYRGAFAQIIPHLTIAQGVSEEVLDQLELEIASVLPIKSQLTHAQLFILQSDRWRPEMTLPFASKL